MGVTMEQIRRLTIEARTMGLEAAEAELRKIVDAQGDVASAAGEMATRTDAAVKTIARAGKEFDALVKKIDPAARAQADLEKGQKTVATALNQGAISATQATAALAALGQRHGNVVPLMTGTAAAVALNRTQMMMLQSTVSNSISSLGSGAGVMQVVMQQGADVAQAFSMGEGGVGGTFKALGGIAGRFLTPVTLGVGALAAVAGVAAYGFIRYRGETDALAHSLDGLGRRSGETLGSLSALAARGASAGGLSLSSGREATATFAGAGIGGPIAEGLIAQSKAFARVTGADLTEANKTLAAAFADPVKGAQKLGDMMGFLDAKTRLTIDSLQGQGDVLGAQRALLAAFAKDLGDATNRTTFLGKAWEFVKNTISNTATGAGKSVSDALYGKSTQDQIDETISKLWTLRAELGQTVASGAGRYGITQSGVDAAARFGIAAEESRLDALERIRDREDRLAAGKMADQRIASNSELGISYMGSVLPDLEKRRELTKQITFLEQAANNPALMSAMGVSVAQVTDAVHLLRDAYAQVLDPLAKIRLEGDLAMRGILARTDAERASLARDRALGGVGYDAASPELRLKADQDRAQTLAQARREAEDRLNAANDNARLVGLLPYQRQRQEITQRWDRQDRLNTGNPDALADNAAARKTELDALARSSIAGPLEESSRALEAQNRLLAVNAATFGMSTDKVVAARTAQEMFNSYVAAGIPITEELRQKVLGLAEGYGQSAKAAEDLQQRQQRAQEGMDALRSDTRSIFSDILHGKKPEDILKSIGGRALDRGADFLTESLLGKPGKMGGGLFGDVIGSLFGASQGVAVGVQNVTAGSVNIIGGLAGLPGLGGTVGGAGSASLETALPRARPGDGAGASLLGLAGSGGGVLSRGAGYQSGVDPRLTDILTKAAAVSPYDVRLVSGLRPGDPRLHGQGLATDVQLFDKTTGAALPNYQDAVSFRQYEDFAQRARMVQMRDYPELGDQFRWGGYFGGSKGTYGAMDAMHFDLGGKPGLGMAGGSWAGGLTPQQLAMFPGAQSIGFGQFSVATQALQQFQATTASATTNLGQFGGGLGQMASQLMSGVTGAGGGGGGLGGLLGGLLGLFGFAQGGAFAGGSVIPFAAGGVVASPTTFAMSGGRTGLMGEAGPEAIMPLARGRDGRLGVRMQGPMGGATSVVNRTSVSIGGHTIVVQGNADEGTIAKMSAELDARESRMEARIMRWTRANAVENSRFASAMRA